ncbi:non-homologous end-joining DNA ligase [uncultured Albimonas sp.]|uniref:non-homologous end-joining DNA ligase n=1 Tax=uncultured Albimonas sp. TaxID=1331701 RepID=UPI0030EF60A2
MREDVAGVRLTHPDKLLWKGQGVSKADLAEHYERAAERMIPLIEGRPLSLVRCPEGRARSCFYQKHAGKGFPGAMGRVAIAEKDGGTEDYMRAGDLSALVAGVQMGTLEYHVWGARADDLERPDRLVIDLDPGPGVSFADVRAAAREVRDRLADLDLHCLAMITGGKGIHVALPLVRRAGWEAAGDFAKGLAKAMARAAPDRFTATATRSRREGRIYVDWLRNRRGATAVAPWSTRAREGCPVATPVAWDELERLKGANVVSLDAAAERLQGPDPWAEAAGWRQSLSARRLRAFTQD